MPARTGCITHRLTVHSSVGLNHTCSPTPVRFCDWLGLPTAAFTYIFVEHKGSGMEKQKNRAFADDLIGERIVQFLVLNLVVLFAILLSILL